jgi:TolB protein
MIAMKKYLLTVAFFLTLFALKAQNSVGIFENHADIGPVIIKGSATYDAAKGLYALKGSGNNMWFKRDEFHFAWKKTKGDFIITTQPTLIGTGGDAHKKTGIIARTGVDTSSAMVCLTVHLDGLTAFQFRKKNGENTQEIKIPMLGTDILQMERRGRSFFVSVAKLGQPFWSVEVPDFDFPEELMLGLFVCSHNPKVTEQANFINTRLFTAVK